jgi:hypothetical protein
MNIKTQFNVGDKVFFLSHNKVTEGRVKRIVVECSKGSSKKDTELVTIRYDIRISDNLSSYDKYESECFPTKEDLINSL